jgi:hypothetical protein
VSTVSVSFIRASQQRAGSGRSTFWGIWYPDGANALPQTPSPGLAQEIQPASAAVIQSCVTGT